MDLASSGMGNLQFVTTTNRVRLDSWLKGLTTDMPSSSNVPSTQIAFQRWFKFKEAFSPNLILDCLKETPYRVRTCIDPFGGCGTTALTSQFLGINPILIEVNPFIADLAEVKLATYDIDSLMRDFIETRRMTRAAPSADPRALLHDAPKSFCEPGINGRWLFRKDTLTRIFAYRSAIETVADQGNAKLLRVMLGSILVSCSNVVVNGKGRKYRQGWQNTQKSPQDVDKAFEAAFTRAIADIQQFKGRGETRYELHRGSCLEQIANVSEACVSIFSPPYPNSFDYTDIYNVELWALGYLKKRIENTKLRHATLRSHVQIDTKRELPLPDSKTLRRTLKLLDSKRAELWDNRLPEMVSGYFADMQHLLAGLHGKLRDAGETFMIVGDSSYQGIYVDVAKILGEIGLANGYETVKIAPLRHMRTSSQQGGAADLRESIVHLRKL